MQAVHMYHIVNNFPLFMGTGLQPKHASSCIYIMICSVKTLTVEPKTATTALHEYRYVRLSINLREYIFLASSKKTCYPVFNIHAYFGRWMRKYEYKSLCTYNDS